MKVLLVQPNNRSYVIMPNLGLGYLAAVLRNAGHEVGILNCLLDRLSAQDFRRRVADQAPDIIGFQLFSYDLNAIRPYLCAARDVRQDAVLVAGGPHPSGDPAGTLHALTELDYAFKGEAETGLPLLLRRLCGDPIGFDDIPGLVYRREDGSVSATAPALVQDLDSLPLPAWDLLQPELYPEAPHGAFTRSFPTAPVITSRGCSRQCTFCAGSTINGGRMRVRSIESVLQELALLHERGIREFHIEDENFTANRLRTLRFCELLEEQGLGMSWSLPSGVRIDTLDADMLDAMERAGCYSVALGIEFGSDRILQLTCKGMDTATMEERLKLFAKRSIKTTGFFLLGIPGETIEEMASTVRFALRLPLDRAQFNNFMPLPGSRLWGELRDRGELEHIEWGRMFVHDVAYSDRSMEPERIKRMQRRAYLRFYLRPRILWGLLAEIRSWRHFMFLLRRFVDSLR